MNNKLMYTLDTNKECYAVQKVKQNDDRYIELTILSNGQPLDCTGCTPALKGKKPDGTWWVQTSNIYIYTSVISFTLSRNFTQVAGEVKLELQLLKDNTQLTTFTFMLQVLPSVIQDGDVKSSSGITATQELDNKINLAKTTEQSVVNSINAVKKTLDTSVANGNTAQMRSDIDTLTNSIVNPNLLINSNFSTGTLYGWRTDGNVVPAIGTDTRYGSFVYFALNNSKATFTQSLYSKDLGILNPGFYSMSAIVASSNFGLTNGIGFVIWYEEGGYSDYTWYGANGAKWIDLGNGRRKIIIVGKSDPNKTISYIDVRIWSDQSPQTYNFWATNIKFERGGVVTPYIDGMQSVLDKNLNTSNKYIVGAINELDGQIGDTPGLVTADKTLVGAINEIKTRSIGIISGLTTTDKTNLVAAINELNSNKENKIVSYKNADGSSWYRKYSDGRLEQGGCLILTASAVTSAIDTNLTFPLAFVGNYDTIRITANGCPTNKATWNSNISSAICYAIDLTKCRIIFMDVAPGYEARIWWEAKGWWK